MNSVSSIMLETRSVTRRYGGFHALDGVNIQVSAGSIHGLIGPNGAGKSTLIDVLSGRADQWDGQVLLEGQDVSSLSIQARRSLGLARSFQRTSIFPNLTVRTQLDLAARTGRGANLDTVMEQLSLSSLAHNVAADLSYGEQRRLDLALAMIGAPRVLLLDEPAAGLTQAESLTLAALLRDLARRLGITVLLVEHDMEVVFSICERITVLHLGKVLVEGSVETIRRHPAVIEAYLGRSAA
jgi:branched-chain amino acid transport system ATP-binding protein